MSEPLLAGKRCLITGGSRSLGRALAVAFARAGAKVAFTYLRQTEEADITRARVEAEGASCLVFQGDVRDGAHARATVDAVVAAWEGLDVLVNNAGTIQMMPLALLEEDDWDAVVDVNLKGPYLFSRAALRPMIRARVGHILNIGSLAGERILEVPLHYAAAKAGLAGLTRALAKEVGRYGIQVNLLSAGLLESGLSQRTPQHRRDEYVAHCPLGRMATLAETAEFAAWLVSPENTFMSGASLAFDGGL